MTSAFQSQSLSHRISRNTVGIFAFRGASFAVNLLLVPISLSYLGTTQYGVWITIASVANWVGFFDFGLGNGLRNRLSESLATEDFVRSRGYLSSAYFALGVMAIVLTGGMLLASHLLDWIVLLNAPSAMRDDLAWVAASVFGFLGLRLGLGLVNSLLYADQRPALVSLLDVLGSLLSFASVYAISRNTQHSIILFGIASSYGPAVVLLVASVILFSTRYRKIAPHYRMFRRDLSSEMIFLGAKFFVLQVVGVVLFATTSVMIAHLFGPDEVAVYAVAFRYYALPMTGFNMLLVPYWSAYTQAFAIGEFEWIRSSIHRLRGYLWWLLLLLLLMMFFAEDIYTVWIKTEVGLPGALSVALVLYVLISSWCNIHVNLINGVGKLNLQIVFALSSVVLFIPLSYVLSTKIILGGAGIVAAICIVLLPACILWPIQSSKLLRGTASGIWGA